jgi:hypothetical protein
MDSSSAQPEALYLDSITNLRMVIERKSLSWPLDYAYRHSNDHFAFEVFSNALRGITFGDLYEIRFPLLIKGKREELRTFALAAAEVVRAKWTQLEPGSGLKERVSADRWWGFRRVPDWEKEESAPVKGLRVTWVGRSMFEHEYLDPSNPPEELQAKVGAIYSACVAKFTTYPDATRILVLDPLGDLRHEPTDWWRELWLTCPPPREIGQIWSGVFDYIDDDSQDWSFERLR